MIPFSKNKFLGRRSRPVARRPRSMFHPAVEVMEERVVLNGAVVAVQAVPSPTAAQAKILNTATATLKQYAGVLAKLDPLAGKMANLSVGNARQPIVRQVNKVVKSFLDWEKVQYQNFQKYVRTAPKTDAVAVAAKFERETHKQVVALSARQVAWYGWASYTTFRTRDQARIASVRRENVVELKAKSAPITKGEADLMLIGLSKLFFTFETRLPSETADTACQSRQDLELVYELKTLTFFLSIVAVQLFDYASPGTVEVFKEQARETWQTTNAALETTEENDTYLNGGTSTVVPAKAAHEGVKAEAPKFSAFKKPPDYLP